MHAKRESYLNSLFDTNIIAEIIWTIWTTLFFCLIDSVLHSLSEDFRLSLSSKVSEYSFSCVVIIVIAIHFLRSLFPRIAKHVMVTDAGTKEWII